MWRDQRSFAGRLNRPANGVPLAGGRFGRATTERPEEVDGHQQMDSAECVRYPGTQTPVAHPDHMTRFAGGFP
jgi:hypothetical protein